jgi:GTPase Era involved in 16S rRNA processing
MNTQAADAWLILNDADAVETKMMIALDKVLSDPSLQEAFMHRLASTRTFHDSVMNMSMNGSMMHSINEVIRRTLESAEVMIQDDYMTRTPRIALRFQSPQGGTFVIQPKVNRS